MKAMKTRHPSHNEQVVKKRISPSKIFEVAFWGTAIWGVLRMAAHFLNFTPYGIGAYARPLLGMYGENSPTGIVLGTVVMFAGTLAATLLYSLLFANLRFWWAGILYGLAFLLGAGFFFRMGNWNQPTLSTEVAWFLSLGLFIGMTVMMERFDEV
ncbi:YqhR family membrane protein [Brevibacillus sp. H7]|uniref:YqhR family membrane protein n=1 Tax=Brevibacillus sp. H7 TaxID=3349138 RepID=UPI0037F5E2E0